MEVLAYNSRVLPQARNAHNQQNGRRRIREGNQRVDRGERRCIRKESSGSEGLQRDFITEAVNECVAKLDHRKAAGADQIVNGCTGEKECLP